MFWASDCVTIINFVVICFICMIVVFVVALVLCTVNCFSFSLEDQIFGLLLSTAYFCHFNRHMGVLTFDEME